MAGDQYEPNRVQGIPLPSDPHARQGEEPQRVMGFSLTGSAPWTATGCGPWPIRSRDTGDGCGGAHAIVVRKGNTAFAIVYTAIGGGNHEQALKTMATDVVSRL